MPDQPKPALHQFADDLTEALKSPEFEVRTFSEIVASRLEPLIDWRAADYHGELKANADYPAEPEGFETFEPAEEWADDILNSLPRSVCKDITERAHERALQHRGE